MGLQLFFLILFGNALVAFTLERRMERKFAHH